MKIGNKKTSKFFHYAIKKNNVVGFEKLRIDYGDSDILVKNRKSYQINAELALDKENFLLSLKINDDFHIQTKNEVLALIRNLNDRFSKSNKESFYIDYEIPAVMNTNKFRKIYATTYIYINALSLLTSILHIDKKNLKELLKDHYNKSSVSRIKRKFYYEEAIYRINLLKKYFEMFTERSF